jgi:hypothetical protein
VAERELVHPRPWFSRHISPPAWLADPVACNAAKQLVAYAIINLTKKLKAWRIQDTIKGHAGEQRKCA